MPLLSTRSALGAIFLLATSGLVRGQGCSNTCPPINFGVSVPALCEGDVIDDVPTDGAPDVRADIQRIYDVCYPSNAGSFSFEDFRGANTVTVIANYYTGCNAGRRESGVFAHVAQKYFDQYGPDRVRFIQSIKGGGTCGQWSSVYQNDAEQLFPDSDTVPNEMPWSVDDSSYQLRDEFFTSPFGHPAYVVLDGNLRVKHKFIGPCCGYELYSDCTPDIARTLADTLIGYLDAILNDDEFELIGGNDSSSGNDEQDSVNVDDVDVIIEDEFTCDWSDWSACSIRCGPTIGQQIRYKDQRCADTTTEGASEIFESRPCQAENFANCNVEDGGLACVPEVGERWEVTSVLTDLDSPRDVKFHPTPGHHLGSSSEGRTFVTPPNSDEAWIINGNNHTISIVPAIDTAFQTTLSRTDRGYYHYLINGTAISFNSVADSGRTPDRDTFNYWAVCNDNTNTYIDTKEPNYFMGPTLYDSSPLNRNLVTRLGEQCDTPSSSSSTTKDEPCYFLHSDMLHEAPSCRGIVHDPELETAYGTVYWAFDSTGNRDNGQLVRFDFQQPHGPGSMDHSIASVRRYVEIELETSAEAEEQTGVHAGMVVHPTRRELFIAVPGKNQILKIDADSGQFARTAREEYPIFSNRLPSFEYSIWECVDSSVFVSDIVQPTGMALSLDGERLYVAERGTGMIHAYEVETGAFLYKIPTNFSTIGGMAFAPNGGQLYFVDDETNSLNAVRVLSECGQDYASRTNPEYTSTLQAAREALKVENLSDLIVDTCTVNPIVPDASLFDQVHLDTGYASDNPDVQSEMAGMDAAAALLANRTDCEYDSELNFDALLLGGYFCHVCLPEQEKTCQGGGTCTNVQWRGYICDNEFKIIADEDSGLPGSYLLQTMNGTNVDASQLLLESGITYKFSMEVEDEEICLSTLVSRKSREDSRFGSVSRTSDTDRERLSSNLLGDRNEKEFLSLGCAINSQLVLETGQSVMTGPQIFVNVLEEPVFGIAMEYVPAESSGSRALNGFASVGDLIGSLIVATLFGLVVN